LISLRDRLAPYRTNIRGWRTRRKIIVIESDDWGSIRMPSRAVYERCLKEGYPVDQTSYERYDSLLSEEDLEALFGLIGGFKDSRGRPPVITANTIMGNPDFEAIASNRAATYQWETLQRTFTRYPRHARCIALWWDAMDQGLLVPQFHGREHLNVALFMEGLRKRDPAARFALENHMAGCIPAGLPARPNLYVETTRFRSEAEKQTVLQAQLEGLDEFERVFGFRSRTLIPTNYTWSSDFNSAVAQAGVEALQGAPVMKEQQVDGSSIPTRRHLGQRNAEGQIKLVRNAFFEPSLRKGSAEDEVNHCLHRIRAAFQMRKPAVISCHRINFCGFIDERNRDINLRALNTLLSAITKRWPDVEFMSSVDLLDVIQQDAPVHV
jgi:hypothetical protein